MWPTSLRRRWQRYLPEQATSSAPVAICSAVEWSWLQAEALEWRCWQSADNAVQFLDEQVEHPADLGDFVVAAVIQAFGQVTFSLGNVGRCAQERLPEVCNGADNDCCQKEGQDESNIRASSRIVIWTLLAAVF